MRIAQVNSRHCHAQPVYGLDLVQAVSLVSDVWHTVSCCEYLTSVLKTPEDRVSEMKEAINRYSQGFWCFGCVGGMGESRIFEVGKFRVSRKILNLYLNSVLYTVIILVIERVAGLGRDGN